MIGNGIGRVFQLLGDDGGNGTMVAQADQDTREDRPVIAEVVAELRVLGLDLERSAVVRFGLVQVLPGLGKVALVRAQDPQVDQRSGQMVAIERRIREILDRLAAAKGNAPLIVASDRPRWIMLTFDLRNSDFPYHSGFPLFIDNAIAWFARERLALRRSPGVVDVPIAGAQIRTIDGRTIPSHDHAAGTAFEADSPGLYVATLANQRQYVAVNLADRQHSAINNSRVRESRNVRSESSLLRRELWFYMLFAALLLIGAEWLTYHRRITL